jgi:hypothetical protein
VRAVCAVRVHPSPVCVRKANGIAFALMLVEHPNAQRIRLLSDNKSGA